MEETIRLQGEALSKFLDDFEKENNQRIWRGMGLTEERANKILKDIPENLPWYEVDRNYMRHQAEQYLKFNNQKQ